MTQLYFCNFRNQRKSGMERERRAMYSRKKKRGKGGGGGREGQGLLLGKLARRQTWRSYEGASVC